MTDKIIDQILQQALSPEIEDAELQSCVQQAMEVKEMRSKNHRGWNMKKFAVVAAIVCLMIGSTAIATNGKIIGWVSKVGFPTTIHSFQDLETLEQKAGIQVDAVESCKNGYRFQKGCVDEFNGVNEENKTLAVKKDIHLCYVKQNKTLDVYMEKKIPGENEGLIPEPTEEREFQGISVKYVVYTYKNVPVDYELTPEDEENSKRVDYEISVGADQVSIEKVCFAIWERDGIEYSIMDLGKNIPAGDLFGIAEDIINVR